MGSDKWIQFNAEKNTKKYLKKIHFLESILQSLKKNFQSNFSLKFKRTPCFVTLWCKLSLIAGFMGPTWGPSGTDRTQVGPMLVPWTLLSGMGRLLWEIKEKMAVVTGPYSICCTHNVNTLRPGMNGQHFMDNTLKCIFLEEMFDTLIQISLQFVTMGSMSTSQPRFK